MSTPCSTRTSAYERNKSHPSFISVFLNLAGFAQWPSSRGTLRSRKTTLCHIDLSPPIGQNLSLNVCTYLECLKVREFHLAHDECLDGPVKGESARLQYEIPQPLRLLGVDELAVAIVPLDVSLENLDELQRHVEILVSKEQVE